MPRSSSETPSDSSHDSLSPRKRAPSEGDDVMLVDSEAPATQAPFCEHVRDLIREEQVLAHYEKSLSLGGLLSGAGRGRTKRRKMQLPMCGICQLSLQRPMMCLRCRFIGCWADRHIENHLQQTQHALAVDITSGSIYCGECRDFQFADSLKDEINIRVDPMDIDSGRKRQPFQPWRPDDAQLTQLENMGRLPCDVLKGFLNLGSTCYLSVIMQCFLHNPLLKNYFLSDKHNNQLCGKPNCMCCELDQIFTEVFSSSSEVKASQASNATSNSVPAPIGPVSLLRVLWDSNAEIAGYSQQDAHECFITLLNQLHLGADGSNNGTCRCFMHQIFEGQLESDVKCGKCGHVNPTVDPTLDISLELKGLPSGKPITLASCLRRFTEQEKLGAKTYSCSQCKTSNNEAVKRLSIRKLPPVLCIQLKRFEHKSAENKSSASKIDLPVKFPASINMAPYTTASIGMDAKGRPSLDHERTYDYDLFAVVNHEGQLNTGHYTNFARSQNEWYRFDDEKITHVTLKECLASVPYMCFYVKKHLEYGSSSAPTAPASASVPVQVSAPAPMRAASPSSSDTSSSSDGPLAEV